MEVITFETSATIYQSQTKFTCQNTLKIKPKILCLNFPNSKQWVNYRWTQNEYFKTCEMSLMHFYLPYTFIGLGPRQALLYPLLFFDLKRHCNYFRPSYAKIPRASVKRFPFYFPQVFPSGQRVLTNLSYAFWKFFYKHAINYIDLLHKLWSEDYNALFFSIQKLLFTLLFF